MSVGVLQRKEYELHPEGPVVLTLADYDGPKEGKFGMQIEWKFDSPETREDGEYFRVHYWTGKDLSTDPRNKLNKLLTAFGFNTETLEPESLDLDDLVGKKLQAMIAHAPDQQGTMRANIDSLVALRKPKPPAANGTVQQQAPAPVATASDPNWSEEED